MVHIGRTARGTAHVVMGENATLMANVTVQEDGLVQIALHQVRTNHIYYYSGIRAHWNEKYRQLVLLFIINKQLHNQLSRGISP